MIDFSQYPDGVFIKSQIGELINANIIQNAKDYLLQPNSLELRMADTYYHMQYSFSPMGGNIEDKIQRFRKNIPTHIPEEGILLLKNNIYIFPLEEHLQLPSYLYGKVNPKSTTGRLGIYTRVMAEGAEFDEVPAGYSGKLYMEVIPKFFDIVLHKNDVLGQLRIMKGDCQAKIAKKDIIISGGEEIVSEIVLSLNTRDIFSDDNIVGYRSRRHHDVIDYKKVGFYNKEDFWVPIQGKHDGFLLEAQRFYILASRERISLPKGICADIMQYHTGFGEIRNHCAGFIDSGFIGNIVFEVENIGLQTWIEHGQKIARVKLLKNSLELPEEEVYGKQIGSNYSGQSLRLAKHFQ